ncbi:MAG: peptidoglycan DD-metalloendopeptidase family protein [Oscillospiraceae bacterium]|nr:peptidoglycan DD-metalloendopeptidase family protein [Oscillospiraceae bacterium]
MKKQKRILSLALAVLMVLAMTPAVGELGPTAYAVTQSDIDDLKGDAKELANERASVKSDLAALVSKRASALEQKALIDKQINLTEREIENTEAQIAGYDVLLNQTAYELEENRKAEEAQYELFCRRARAMEEAGTSSYWSVLFKADSFSDLLSRLSDIQEVMDYDQSVLDGLRQIKAQIQAKQEEQEELKAGSEAAKVTLEEKKADLAEQRKAAEAMIQELNSDVAEVEKELKELQAAEDALQKEIKNMEAELAKQLNWTASVGGYIWPETVSKRITSPMGGRDINYPGASTNHKGVDIGGVGYSTNVLATKAGQVMTAAYHKSYGNYVVIFHGTGNTTLYAHMSSIKVKVGDYVNQGDVIGVTGCTGVSTGPHLHYEITENGARVNPLNYLPGYIKAW